MTYLTQKTFNLTSAFCCALISFYLAPAQHLLVKCQRIYWCFASKTRTLNADVAQMAEEKSKDQRDKQNNDGADPNWEGFKDYIQ
jgi:hypothetical protein